MVELCTLYGVVGWWLFTKNLKFSRSFVFFNTFNFFLLLLLYRPQRQSYVWGFALIRAGLFNFSWKYSIVSSNMLSFWWTNKPISLLTNFQKQTRVIKWSEKERFSKLSLPVSWVGCDKMSSIRDNLGINLYCWVHKHTSFNFEWCFH